MTLMRQYNVGIYVRLSKDDVENPAKSKKISPFQNGSVSIENQKIILNKYAEVNGWNVEKVYSDAGFSGGNFDRPGFEVMLADAEKGAIDMILVKDLSRFGRDYVDVGHYVRDVFPSLGVRFIALMDGIDSDGDMDLLPFRSFLNDYYLKDLSKKIKSVLRAKAKSGKYVAGSVAYGYQKDSENPHKLTVDPYASEVVKRIFDLRLNNTAYGKIAAALNKDGILSPRMYYYENMGRDNPYDVTFKWSERTVKLILKNEIYIGNTAYLKSRTVSHKSRKAVTKPAEDWIRTENTHESIIDKAVWEAIQKVNLYGSLSKQRANQTSSLFSGLLICSDCGHSLIVTSTNKQRNGKLFQYKSYICSYYKRTGTSECSCHSISEQTVLQLIREDIRRQLAQIDIDENYILSEVQKNLTDLAKSKAENNLQKLSVRLDELDTLSMKLYEDRLDGTITLDTFKRLSAEAEAERSKVQSEFDKLTALLRETEKKITDVNRWIENMRSYLTLENINRDTLVELVERIEVGERENDGRGMNAQQNIQIVYRF